MEEKDAASKAKTALSIAAGLAAGIACDLCFSRIMPTAGLATGQKVATKATAFLLGQAAGDQAVKLAEAAVDGCASAVGFVKDKMARTDS